MTGDPGIPAPSAVLVILDGWGLAPPGPGNAVELADTPVFDDLWARYPHTQLTACGRAVGLPDGQMGNSEVGHLNLGAGRVVQMDITRIDALIASGEFQKNPAIVKAMQRAREGGRQLHLNRCGLAEAHAGRRRSADVDLDEKGPRDRIG